VPPPRRPRPPRRDAPPPALKRFGQHFLSDAKLLARIADAAQLEPHETVIEVGPGRGALTAQLAARAKRVIAIEIDRTLAQRLRDHYAGDARVEIVEGDVLAQDLGALAGGPYALVGNVPYYITTPILFHALRAPRPTRAVFLVQREVAERMAAPPGSKTYGALSVTLQALAGVELLFGVPPGAFKPPPKVESAVVRITPRARTEVPTAQEERYRRMVQAAFAQRRKQMRRVVRSLASLTALEADKMLEGIGIGPEARPETLSPADFTRLLAALGDVPAFSAGS
jgi:16S rRNA (adenine1518-N6/adenine1519-N6)-dimethyltransferase